MIRLIVKDTLVKVNLHVVGDEENAKANAAGLDVFLTGPDPLEELLNEFSNLEEDLERELLAQDLEREREIEAALKAELEAARARENEFIPEQSQLEVVLNKLRDLEESLKYMSFLTHEIDQYGP